MSAFRLLAQAARIVLALLWIGLAAAILLALGTDHNDDGSLRITAFPLALSLFDSQTWDCLRNTLLVATVSTLGALMLGIPLGRWLANWKFWGRPLVAVLLLAPLVLPRFQAALGMRLLLGSEVLSPWSRPDAPWYQPWNWSIGGAWLAWTWIATSAGAALVALFTTHALDLADPQWEEAGLASGASKRQVWRSIVWPLLRPRVARASVLAFGATMLEPGTPLLFGLRTSLPYQIVESISSPATGKGRAATLASLALVLIMGLNLLLRRPRGRPVENLNPDSNRPLRARSQRAPWRRAIWLLPLSTLIALAVCAPWLSLVLSPSLPGLLDANNPRILATDPRLTSSLLASLLVGAISTGLGLFLACCLHLRPASRLEPATTRSLSNLGLVPPLALGLAFALLPLTLLDLGSLLGIPYLPRAFAALSRKLDPFQNQGVALILALSLGRLPVLFWGVERLSSHYRAQWVEAAEVLGASRARAVWDLVRPRVLLPLLALTASSFALSATDLSSSLLLCPTSLFSPVSLTALRLADEPSGLMPAYLLTLLASAFSLLVFLLAAPFWLDLFRPRSDA